MFYKKSALFFVYATLMFAVSFPALAGLISFSTKVDGDGCLFCGRVQVSCADAALVGTTTEDVTTGTRSVTWVRRENPNGTLTTCDGTVVTDDDPPVTASVKFVLDYLTVNGLEPVKVCSPVGTTSSKQDYSLDWDGIHVLQGLLISTNTSVPGVFDQGTHFVIDGGYSSDWTQGQANQALPAQEPFAFKEVARMGVLYVNDTHCDASMADGVRITFTNGRGCSGTSGDPSTYNCFDLNNPTVPLARFVWTQGSEAGTSGNCNSKLQPTADDNGKVKFTQYDSQLYADTGLHVSEVDATSLKCLPGDSGEHSPIQVQFNKDYLRATCYATSPDLTVNRTYTLGGMGTSKETSEEIPFVSLCSVTQ